MLDFGYFTALDRLFTQAFQYIWVIIVLTAIFLPKNWKFLVSSPSISLYFGCFPAFSRRFTQKFEIPYVSTIHFTCLLGHFLLSVTVSPKTGLFLCLQYTITCLFGCLPTKTALFTQAFQYIWVIIVLTAIISPKNWKFLVSSPSISRHFGSFLAFSRRFTQKFEIPWRFTILNA